MTKIPKIEIWDINKHLPHSYERWVMTEDNVICQVSPAWRAADPAGTFGLVGKTLDYLVRLFDWAVERDDRISDS